MGQNSSLQSNCRGLKPNFKELLILSFNPKICCLQEALLTPNDNLDVRNYSSDHYMNNNCFYHDAFYNNSSLDRFKHTFTSNCD